MDWQDKLMVFVCLFIVMAIIVDEGIKMSQQQQQAAVPVAKVFNGTYTISSPTGQHRTFRVRTILRGQPELRGKRIVELLVGPDNENSYQPFAFIDDAGVAVWRKLRGTDKPSLYDQYARLLWSLAVEGERSVYFQKGCTLLKEGRCIRCNRKLTHPESITSGIGPECATKTFG